MHEVTLVSTPREREDAYAVRVRVFVEEQGVPLDLELDALDETADHFLARDGGRRPVGAGRLVAQDGVGVLGRLAVLPEARGTGVGVRLVRAIEEHARARGLTSVELHAQTRAGGFYRRLGYEAYGEEEMEAGIPHVWMRKPLA
jgi:predicted GNAT family N-acyltransferase